MINVKDCRVSNDNTKIYIDVETTEGYLITHASLWSESTFKVLSKEKSLPILKTSNRELLTITAASVGLSKFDGIYFIEFETDAPNATDTGTLAPVTAVITNLVSYYKCAMNMLLRVSGSQLDLFNARVVNDGDANNVMAIHLLIDGITQAIKLNRFLDAINLLSNLRILCSSCSDCGDSALSGTTDCADCGSTTIHYQ